MCKTDEKTSQYYFFTATKFPTEAEKIGSAKHIMSWLLTLEDKNETKYNSISFLYYNG